LARVNSDWCKLWVHERIRWPIDQPGAFFLPMPHNDAELAAADDYAAQLVSEARLRKPSGKVLWMQLNRNNHFLDCEAMAYAAGYLIGVHRIRETEVNPVEAMKLGAEQIPLRSAKPRPPRKRIVIDSPFLAR
jgi:phage terminase large subunit GpA-like protein